MSSTAPQDAKSSAIKRLGGFELITKIGRGGMGAVYKARQLSLDRVVAVKILPPSLAKSNPLVVDRFFREARSCAKLNHPNIVQGIEVGKDDATGLYYFAMEYIDGPTVLSLLKEQQQIPEKRAIEIVLQVTHALICAHHAGIIHRDIKPDNILLTSKGEVKLADLGLARGLLDTSPEDFDPDGPDPGIGAKLTQVGKAVGTPAYMAPEQVRGEIEALDARTDLYALGGTFYHMVTGRRPYKSKSTQDTMNLQISAPVPKARDLAPDLSEATAAIIFRLMQKSPADRFQSAEALAKALNGEPDRASSSASSRSHGVKTTARRAPVTGRLDAPIIELRRPSRWSRAMGLLGAAAAIAFVAALYALRTPPPARANVAPSPALQPAWTQAAAPVEKAGNRPASDLPASAAAKVTARSELKPAESSAPAVIAAEKDRVEAAQLSAPAPSPAVVTPVNAAPPAVAPVAKLTVAVPPATHIDIANKPADEQDSTKIAAATVTVTAPAKPDPALPEQALARVKASLDTLNLPPTVSAVKAFEAEKKLTPVDCAIVESALGAAIESRANALAAEVDALSAKGEFDPALERLNAAVFRNNPDRSNAELEAQKLIVDLRETVSINKALYEMQAQIRQSALLEPVFQNVAALMDAGNADQAGASLDRALARADLASVADLLKTQKQLLPWFADIRAALDKGAAALMDGRQVTLNFVDGKPVHVGKGAEYPVIGAASGVLTVQKKRQNARQIKLDTLTHDSKYDLSVLGAEKDDPGALKLKVKWAYADLLAVTPNTPRAAPIVDAAERDLNNAAGNDAAKVLAADVRPWLIRAQKLLHAGHVRPGIMPYLSFLSVAAPLTPGGQFKIAVNGKPMLQGPEHAGLNLVAFEGDKLLKHDTFDTLADPAAAQRFADCVGKLPKNALAIVAICGDAGKVLNDTSVAALTTLGATQVQRGFGKKPAAYLCIGSTSPEQGAIIEDINNAVAVFPH